MDITLLLAGLAAAVTPMNLLFALIGVSLGTVVGILPGIGSASTMALLLPITLTAEPATGLIMLAGVYYGSKYGGALTAIFVNLPGESSSVVTMVDGHPLAKAGRGGPVAGIAAISSFVGGTVAVIGITLLAPLLAEFALRFGPAEYFALAILGLASVTFLSTGNRLKTLIMVIFGLTLAVVGTDGQTGAPRLTFGFLELLDGTNFAVVAVGLFGIGELLLNAEEKLARSRIKLPNRVLDYLPTRADLVQCLPTWLRSSLIGLVVGILPGAGTTVASFLCYGVERSLSRSPERFGNGAIEGVAAAETADNAAAGGNLIPLLSLGIPDGSTTAILLAAFIAFGIQPGPFLFVEHADVAWALIASMYVGNLMLLIINLPLAPLLVQALRAPYPYLGPAIAAIALTGVYSINNSVFDVGLAVGFGVLGYLLRKGGFPLAPAVLALALGAIMERSLRRALLISPDGVGIFFNRPLALGLLLVAAALLAVPAIRLLVKVARRNPQTETALARRNGE